MGKNFGKHFNQKETFKKSSEKNFSEKMAKKKTF